MKNIIIASIIGIMSITATSAYASHGEHNDRSSSSFYDRARVTNVEPIYTTVRISTPHRECYTREVRSEHYNQGNKAASTVLGGIIGGAVGHNVGRHKKGATVAGAIIGAVVGNELGKKGGQRHEQVRYEDVCDTTRTYEEEQRIDGYNVTYRYKGEYFTTRMDQRPGKRLRVRVHVSPVVD